ASAIEKVPTGGRKKKLRHSIAATEVATATHRRDVAATTSTTRRNELETIAAFDTRSHSPSVSVTTASATPAATTCHRSAAARDAITVMAVRPRCYSFGAR